MYFLRDSLSLSPSLLGAILKGKNLLPFLDLSEGMENYKMSGKKQGILRWMISGNPDFC